MAIVFDAPHDGNTPMYWASISWIKPPSDIEEADREEAWCHAKGLSRHEDHSSFFLHSANLLILDVNLSTSRLTVDRSTIGEARYSAIEEVRLPPLVLGWEDDDATFEKRNLPGLIQVLDVERYARVDDALSIFSQLTEFGDSGRQRLEAFLLWTPLTAA
ncbi:hypothetical protein [Modicisalibacter luteus]|uniref:hypothetical protein n=1 Tax=Modicisalibacter luteus TaxID=453962 RepID=UPI0036421808